MASPSPVPWKVTGLATDDPVIQDRDGEYVTWIDAGPDALNAEFIVRAVNSHEELLAACKAALPWVAISMAGRDPDATHPDAYKNHAEDLALLQAAIAKAEGVTHAQ